MSIEILTNEPLAKHTFYGVGGPANEYCIIRSSLLFDSVIDVCIYSIQVGMVPNRSVQSCVVQVFMQYVYNHAPGNINNFNLEKHSLLFCMSLPGLEE